MIHSKVLLLRWPCVSVRTRLWYLGLNVRRAHRESSSGWHKFYIMLKPFVQHIAQRLIHGFFMFFLGISRGCKIKSCCLIPSLMPWCWCCAMLRPQGWPHLRQDVHSTKGEDEGCGNGRSAVDSLISCLTDAIKIGYGRLWKSIPSVTLVNAIVTLHF